MRFVVLRLTESQEKHFKTSGQVPFHRTSTRHDDWIHLVDLAFKFASFFFCVPVFMFVDL